MKVLLINGSPKEKGCTYTALRAVESELLAAGLETEIFHIGSVPIGGCRDCKVCFRTKRCIFEDVVNVGADKIAAADAIVFGSPVHYASLSGNMTCFLDRVAYSQPHVFRYKPAAICVTARRAGTTSTLDQLVKYPMFFHMPLVNASYWPMVHGNTPEELVQDLEGMDLMRQLGYNMAWLLHCIESGKAAGYPHPPHQQRTTTNFIR